MISKAAAVIEAEDLELETYFFPLDWHQLKPQEPGIPGTLGE